MPIFLQHANFLLYSTESQYQVSQFFYSKRKVQREQAEVHKSCEQLIDPNFWKSVVGSSTRKLDAQFYPFTC